MSKLLYRDWSSDQVKVLLNHIGVKKIWSQNSKMKKSSDKQVILLDFAIPAFRSESGQVTCPNATKCVSGCYARQGRYRMPNVKNSLEAKLNLTLNEGFEQVVVYELDRYLKRNKDAMFLLRIHSSGDFYSEKYYEKWKSIAKAFTHENRVLFYAYTKMVHMIKKDQNRLVNFEIIYSLGGSQDNLIDCAKDRHSRVFETVEQLTELGYTNTSHDDVLALGPNNKIGLSYHGNKSFKNTNWEEV